MAKAPRKKGTTPMTGRTEKGESFTAGHVLWQDPEWLMVAAAVVVAAASLWLGAYRASQP